MKRLLLILTAAMLAVAPLRAGILDFSTPSKPLDIGIRLGINTSNMSNNYTYANPAYRWTSTDWGTGFTGGVVVDLNIAKSFALQPGFYFQSRNMDYRYEFNTPTAEGEVGMLDHIESGHIRSYNFEIPIMFSFRFNLTSLFQVRAEVGPYFQCGIDGNDKYTVSTPNIPDVKYKRDIYGDDGFMRSYDWGFKIGGGLTLLGRYHLSIHYEAGCRNIYKQPIDLRHDLSGKNKTWDVTFGYDIF
ncbi:MAG: PorT family protein [Muribaculaceae bacterium]|nr:PorT family protein [Muribaculaceae bacterium]